MCRSSKVLFRNTEKSWFTSCFNFGSTVSPPFPGPILPQAGEGDKHKPRREEVTDIYILKTDAKLDSAHKEILREDFKERTGEDCLILDCGLTLEYFPGKKEQPLFKRLFG